MKTKGSFLSGWACVIEAAGPRLPRPKKICFLRNILQPIEY